jgi:hypothetical protein
MRGTIRNFVIRNSVHYEFSAFGTLLLRNFVIRNLVIRNFVIRNFDIRNFVPVPKTVIKGLLSRGHFNILI